MRTIRIIIFFSRVAAICNGCFIIYLVLQAIERHRLLAGKGELSLYVPGIKELIITLAILSIFINAAMLICYGILFAIKRRNWIPRWLAIINMAMLLFQFWHFFIRHATL